MRIWGAAVERFGGGLFCRRTPFAVIANYTEGLIICRAPPGSSQSAKSGSGSGLLDASTSTAPANFGAPVVVRVAMSSLIDMSVGGIEVSQ